MLYVLRMRCSRGPALITFLILQKPGAILLSDQYGCTGQLPRLITIMTASLSLGKLMLHLHSSMEAQQGGSLTAPPGCYKLLLPQRSRSGILTAETSGGERVAESDTIADVGIIVHYAFGLKAHCIQPLDRHPLVIQYLELRVDD